MPKMPKILIGISFLPEPLTSEDSGKLELKASRDILSASLELTR